MDIFIRHRNTLETVRRLLWLIIFLGLIGIQAELVIEKHTETIWQIIPVLLIALALVVLGWIYVDQRGAPVRVWQVLMLLFVLSGFVGFGLHWRGKIEFKRESDSSLSGARLFWEAMKSQSPPALAPGAMIQLGLLGLVYAYRHPALRPGPKGVSGGGNE